MIGLVAIWIRRRILLSLKATDGLAGLSSACEFLCAMLIVHLCVRRLTRRCVIASIGLNCLGRSTWSQSVDGGSRYFYWLLHGTM